MPSRVTEIAADLYRISTFHADYGIQFNQFLVRDEQPFLMHTGFRRMFDTTLEAVRAILDPATLRWIGFSHFEADECGALNQWLRVAPRAQAVCSMVGAMVSLSDYADRPPRGLEDDEVFAIGRHRLRFLATPHVPHGWDAGLFFEETEHALLCSDLFFQPGDPAALAVDVVAPARESIRASLAGSLAKDIPYTPDNDGTLQRLAALNPRLLATMHGASFRGDGARALRDFAGVVKEFLA
jgi:flavorubredoxin